MVCVVCAPNPFSDIMFHSPFVYALLTLEFSIKCFLRDYVVLLVYLTKWKFRIWNQLTTAQAHSSSAVSWSLTVPITAFKNAFFLSPLQTPVEHRGAKWMGLVTLQNGMLALREEPENAWETGEGWLLPAELRSAFSCTNIKCRQPHAWDAHDYTSYVKLLYPKLFRSFPACMDVCGMLLWLTGGTAGLAGWQVLLPSLFVLLAHWTLLGHGQGLMKGVIMVHYFSYTSCHEAI